MFRQESHTMNHFTISEPLLLYTLPLEAKEQEKILLLQGASFFSLSIELKELEGVMV